VTYPFASYQQAQRISRFGKRQSVPAGRMVNGTGGWLCMVRHPVWAGYSAKPVTNPRPARLCWPSHNCARRPALKRDWTVVICAPWRWPVQLAAKRADPHLLD